MLAAEGMLRPGLRPDDLDYTLPTVVFGSFAAEPFLPPSLGLTLEQKADQLADAVRRAFEPAGVPSRAAVKRAAVKSIPILGRAQWAINPIFAIVNATISGDNPELARVGTAVRNRPPAFAFSV